MRTLAIGDIHGCLKALETLVEFVSVKKEDTLVTLGDYIDRGPDSKGVIDLLTKLKETHKVVTLKGNHELMMENARHSQQERYFWLVNGGDATLDSFNTTHLDSIGDDYWEFIADCQLYHETRNHILVHAGLEPDLPLSEQPEDSLLWKRIHDTRPHVSGKTLICGHTPQRSGVPLVLAHAICIDTFPLVNGWLTCMDVDNGTCWQATQKGETRMWNLSS